MTLLRVTVPETHIAFSAFPYIKKEDVKAIPQSADRRRCVAVLCGCAFFLRRICGCGFGKRERAQQRQSLLLLLVV